MQYHYFLVVLKEMEFLVVSQFRILFVYCPLFTYRIGLNWLEFCSFELSIADWHTTRDSLPSKPEQREEDAAASGSVF